MDIRKATGNDVDDVDDDDDATIDRPRLFATTSSSSSCSLLCGPFFCILRLPFFVPRCLRGDASSLPLQASFSGSSCYCRSVGVKPTRRTRIEDTPTTTITTDGWLAGFFKTARDHRLQE